VSVALAILAAQLEATVPARNDVPSEAQYEQAVMDAVEDFGARRPMQSTYDVAVVSGTASYTLPADFVKLIKFESVLSSLVDGVLNTSDGLIPVSATFRERVMVQGGSLVISPTPTYNATRRLWYGAKHVLNESEVYTTLTEVEARIVLLKAQALALGWQANSMAGAGWRYRISDEEVDKSKLGSGLRDQAQAKEAEYRAALEAMGCWGIRADYDVLGQ
jgi:hypothetical protein